MYHSTQKQRCSSPLKTSRRCIIHATQKAYSAAPKGATKFRFSAVNRSESKALSLANISARLGSDTLCDMKLQNLRPSWIAPAKWIAWSGDDSWTAHRVSWYILVRMHAFNIMPWPDTIKTATSNIEKRIIFATIHQAFIYSLEDWIDLFGRTTLVKKNSINIIIVENTFFYHGASSHSCDLHWLIIGHAITSTV